MIYISYCDDEAYYHYVFQMKNRVVRAYNRIARRDRRDEVEIDLYYVGPNTSDYESDYGAWYRVVSVKGTLLAVYRENRGCLQRQSTWPISVEDGTATTYILFMKEINAKRGSNCKDEIIYKDLAYVLEELSV